MDCAVCAVQAAAMGVLCEDCRDDVVGPFRIMPEQVLITAMQPSPAALIDAWGRCQRVDARTFVGRQLGRAGVSLIDGSVSRHHAHLALDTSRSAWSVRDLGSRNGTYVNGAPLTGPAVSIKTRDIITFGQVPFYFLADAQRVPEAALDPRAATTLPVEEQACAPALDDVAREDTVVGRRFLEMRLLEPSGGGGGVIEVRGYRVQLSPVQFECVQRLTQRMIDDAERDDADRGFVSTAELVGHLSWETNEPSDANVKQIVRKLRTILAPAMGDLIESRRGAGYRLRVIPLLRS